VLRSFRCVGRPQRGGATAVRLTRRVHKLGEDRQALFGGEGPDEVGDESGRVAL
jgi:hypothetical protein